VCANDRSPYRNELLEPYRIGCGASAASAGENRVQTAWKRWRAPDESGALQRFCHQLRELV